MNLQWIARMAWRDSRRNRGRLLLFVSSIILGIAALVAIQSFGYNLRQQINNEAKALLGADMQIEHRQPFSDTLLSLLDSMGMELSHEVNFASMVLFEGQNTGTRLVNVRAMDGKFPFFGTIEVLPNAHASAVLQQQQALPEAALMAQYGSAPGDTLVVGNVRFGIAAGLMKFPGQSGIAATVAPPVLIPLSWLDSTGLVQRGSRIIYRLYLRYPNAAAEAWANTTLKPLLEQRDLRFEDADGRREQLGNAYNDLTGFLNLTAFIALLLGCVGVAGAVHVYVREKLHTVALLRCLGVPGKYAMYIFLLQILMVSTGAALAGAIAGSALQYALPALLGDFLPVEVTPTLSLQAIGQGMLTGLLAALVFALFPLLGIRRTSPLRVLRVQDEDTAKGLQALRTDPLRWLTWPVVLLFTAGFARLQTDNWAQALGFVLALLLALGLLALMAWLITWLVKKLLPLSGSFVWKHGLSNLFRPNNQTRLLVISIGLGTALITTLLLSQQLLLNKVKVSAEVGSRPNMVVFDIQEQQVEGVQAITAQNELPNLGAVPIVTMRLHSLKGKPVAAWKADTTSKISGFALEREYRVTYRDTLIDSETLLKGTWRGRVAGPGDSIFVSWDEGFAERLQLQLGDAVTFDVQGALIETYVGSFRKVDFQRVQTNFLVLFPAGVLEQAPKFFVQLSRYAGVEQSARYQTQLVKSFPNVSVIDLNLVLETIDEILSKVSFVIKFMALFSIITGLVVLIGAVRMSKYQRVQEVVLLRTLGASRRQLMGIQAVEFLLLGSLAALTGTLLAIGAAVALAHFSFKVTPEINMGYLLAVWVSITGLTLLIGWLNTRRIVGTAPLEILRKEG